MGLPAALSRPCSFAHKIVCNKPVAEEIVSDAFIKIWQRHGLFSEWSGLKAYLYRTVHNDALKHLQKGQREARFAADLQYHLGVDYQPDHFHYLIAAETSRQLLASLDTLPPECRRVFNHLYVEEKTVLETARELNLSVSTVKTQKQRGLKALRGRLAIVLLLLVSLMAV